MSEFEDKTLSCVDCSSEFVFTVGQQEFHAEKGFTNEPKRCDPCRAAKKASMGSGGGNRGGGNRGGGGEREFHSAICAGCGQEARLPFKPRGDRPVYCSNCFQTQKQS